MALIDEEGDLFGRWNAVDVLALVFAVAVVGAAVVVGASALGSEPEPIATQVVEVRSTGNPPALARSVGVGPVATPGIVEVLNVSTTPVAGNVTIDLRVRLRIETTEDGLTMYAGERLYIGREVTLPLNGVNVTGVVVGASAPEAFRRTPTPTPSPTPPPTTVTTPTTATERPTPGTQLTPPEPLTAGTRRVTIEATVSDAAIEVIEAGPVASEGVVEIVTIDATSTGDGYEAVLEVVLRVRTTEDGAVLFNGVELRSGQRVVLDLGEAVVVAKVTDV